MKGGSGKTTSKALKEATLTEALASDIWPNIIAMLVTFGVGEVYLKAMTGPAFDKLKDEEKLFVVKKSLDSAHLPEDKKKSLIDKIRDKFLKETKNPTSVQTTLFDKDVMAKENVNVSKMLKAYDDLVSGKRKPNEVTELNTPEKIRVKWLIQANKERKGSSKVPVKEAFGAKDLKVNQTYEYTGGADICRNSW
jgi:hypothetical protein